MAEQIETTGNARRLRILLPFASIGLGVILAICGDSYHGSMVSYLDMGDNFFAGDPKAILNALWSPLFPFIQGLTRWLFKPAILSEPTLVQGTNLVIFVSTVVAFQFFLSQVFRLYRYNSHESSKPSEATFSENEFWCLGYAIFLFMHLDVVSSTTPDMLLSTIVYLSAGLLLIIKLSGATLFRFCLLGLLLGIGFLTKAVILPLSVVFLAGAALQSFPKRFILFYVLAASTVFACVIGPYIYELSREKGHFTTGEAEKLNYAWHVNGAPFAHWHGEIAGLGKPEHPTRQIFAAPAIYEFAAPVRGTYPPYYNPSYWNAGIQPRFRLRDQLNAIAVNFKLYLKEFWSQYSLITCVLLLVALRRDVASLLREFLGIWYLWLPAAVAAGLYGLVWVEHRYMSQFFVVFWVAAMTLVHFSGGTEARRIIRVVAIVAILLLSLRIAINLIEEGIGGHLAADQQMAIAQGLSAQGVGPGEKVAIIDAGLGEGWQKLARLVVVAEIPAEERDTFWASDSDRRTRAYNALVGIGANVLIAPKIPTWAQAIGWEKVGFTPVYIYRLKP